MPRAKVTSNGLKIDLREKGYKAANSISEYIWNGFDAEATLIEIKSCYAMEGIDGGLVSFSIIDNGNGIPNPNVFDKLYESNKKKYKASQKRYAESRKNSKTHGRYNLGRKTFFTFSSQATWHTVFQGDDGLNYRYTITIKSSSLIDWKATDPVVTDEPTGTKVTFEGLNSDFLDVTDPEILSFLSKEFSWKLELGEALGYSIIINGIPLDYQDQIDKKEKSSVSIDGCDLDVKFILWKEKQNKEASRYYLLDKEGDEKLTNTTTLNRQSDSFYHSLYVSSKSFGASINPSIYDDSKAEELALLLSDAEKS